MNCAIIGAGQLGSRHLQGLLSYKKESLNIFIIDPSDDSLFIAKQRALELEHKHSLTFTDSFQELPKHLDFVVIATNSKVRFVVMEILLQHASVSYLILEKVLFPDLEQYDKALKMVKENNIKCWVNHPRRMYNAYRELKNVFDTNKTYTFHLTGASWGLACNGLHYIDLFEFLTDSKLSTISNDLLDGLPVESKRSGYLEFEGTLLGTLNNKHTFSITSLKNQDLIAPTMSIMTDDVRIIIQESGTPKVYFLKKENNFDIEENSFQVLYQSQLTGTLLEQIQTSGTCDLPSFEHASSTHKLFIESILNKWNNETNSYKSTLPIT